VVELGIPKRTLERDISKIKKKGYLSFLGAPKTGGYVLTGKGKKLLKDIMGKISL
jgi:Mn-dependent DtxR family transcriptional regulator